MAGGEAGGVFMMSGDTLQKVAKRNPLGETYKWTGKGSRRNDGHDSGGGESGCNEPESQVQQLGAAAGW